MSEDPGWDSCGGARSSGSESTGMTKAIEDDDGVELLSTRHFQQIRRAASYDSIFGDAHVRGLGAWFPSQQPRHHMGFGNEDHGPISYDPERRYLPPQALPRVRSPSSVDSPSDQVPSAKTRLQALDLGVVLTSRIRCKEGSRGADAILGSNIRRTEDINVFENSWSNSDVASDASSGEESDEENLKLDERLQHPTQYFHQLNILTSKVFSNSMFEFYAVSIRCVLPLINPY